MSDSSLRKNRVFLTQLKNPGEKKKRTKSFQRIQWSRFSNKDIYVKNKYLGVFLRFSIIIALLHFGHKRIQTRDDFMERLTEKESNAKLRKPITKRYYEHFLYFPVQIVKFERRVLYSNHLQNRRTVSGRKRTVQTEERIQFTEIE